MLNQQTPDTWTDTGADEALNDAAFLLYERALVNDLDFGMYMVEAGCKSDLGVHLHRHADRDAAATCERRWTL